VFFSWNTQIQALVALLLVVVFIVLHVYAKVHALSNFWFYQSKHAFNMCSCKFSTSSLFAQPFAREPKFEEVDVLGML
jgi:hypothetical protein